MLSNMFFKKSEGIYPCMNLHLIILYKGTILSFVYFAIIQYIFFADFSYIVTAELSINKLTLALTYFLVQGRMFSYILKRKHGRNNAKLDWKNLSSLVQHGSVTASKLTQNTLYHYI